MAILKAAVIGTGNRAQAHLAVVPTLVDRYRLVAVCDIDGEKARAAAAGAGAAASYTDIEEMLDRETPDVGLVAVQAEIHHAVARILAGRKVHILTETPIALTVPCADAMVRAARENGVFMEVSENARRWPHERLKRKIVEAGLLGKVREFYLSYTSGSYHGIAAVRAILGSEPKSVAGEFPDQPNVRERGKIEWSDGIQGVYEYNSDRKNYWEIIGEKGALRGMELHLFEGDRKLSISTQTAGEGPSKRVTRACVPTDPEIAYHSPHQAYALPSADSVAVADAWCSLHDAVVLGARPGYGGEDARRDIELLMAVRESASRGGRRVALPLIDITGHERLIHEEFAKVYDADILDLQPRHLKRKYDLPGRLRELMYYGRILTA